MAKPISVEDLDHILNCTQELWSEMRGERIFITGGTGFFGSWLVESFCHINRLAGLGASATILTRNPAAFLQKSPHLAVDASITLLAGDVRDFAFPHGDFKFVLHAATESVARNTPVTKLELLHTMLRGTERVLQFAATHSAAKLLLASSGAVYGSQPSDLVRIPEDFRGAPNVLEPDSFYGEGKRLAELLCALQAAESKLECKIARCFAFVGPHLPLDAHFAIGNFMRDAIENQPIRIEGDGTPMRSYLYAADLAVWLWTLLFRGKSAHAYNVGSDQALSIFELAQQVVATLQPACKIEVLQQALPGAPVLRYVPETTRAFSELGLQQRIHLPEAIRRTAAWHGFLPQSR